jgi:hypothetical protein
VDQWLYWDIHSTHATRTFGVTRVEPIASAFAPESPVADQHWFDTTNNIMKVWQNNRWYNKIRVFACKLSGGSVATSISLNYPRFDGTQVGINTPVAAGSIMFDSISGKPLRADDKFITTEDVISTVPLTKSDVKVESMVVSGEAQLPMARYTAVYFAEFGRITHATDALMAGDYIPVGILQSDCVSGDVIDVTMTGVVTAYEWNWDVVGINAPLYINSTGQITPTKTLDGQRPIGYVVDTRSIVLGMTNIQTYAGAAGVSLLSELGDVTLTSPTNGQFLKFNGTEWVNGVVPTPVTDLNGLSDVTLATPSTGQALLFNGTEWVNGDVASPVAPGYRQIYDATEGQTVFTLLNDYTPGGGQLSVYINGLKQTPTTYTETNATSFTLSQPAREADIVLAEISEVTPAYITPITMLDQLSDVTINTPAADQVLKFVGGQWINDNLVIANALNDLTDVTITTPAADHYLRHNGTEWVNTPLSITPDRISAGDVTLLVDDVTNKCTLTVGTAQVVDITETDLVLSGPLSGTWSLLYGDITADIIEHFFISSTTDSTGNIYVGGGDQGAVAGNSILLKLSPTGELLWGKHIALNDDNWQVCDSVIVDANDNVYAISNVNGANPARDYTLIHKFSPSGTLLWQREFADTTNAMFIHIETGCFRNNGNMVLTGGSRSSSYVVRNGIIAEITSAGSLVTVRAIPDVTAVSDVSYDTVNDSLLITAYWLTPGNDQTIAKILTNWSIPWCRTYDYSVTPYQINGVVYQNGFVYASGQASGAGCMVIKLDATTGVVVWEKQITDVGVVAWGDCLVADPDTVGTFYVGSGGNLAGNDYWFVYKLDSAGSVLAACRMNYVEGAYTYSGQWWNWGHKWLTVKNGNVSMCGYTYGNLVYTSGEGVVVNIPGTLPSAVVGAFQITSTTSTIADVVTTVYTTIPTITDVAANCVSTTPTVTPTITVPPLESVFAVDTAPFNINLRGTVGANGNTIMKTAQGAVWVAPPISPVVTVPLTQNVTMPTTAWTDINNYTLPVDTTSTYNLALGPGAMHSNTTGNYGIAIGSQSLYYNTTGAYNVALGANALNLNTIGSDNVAMGVGALQNNTTGVRNIAIGTGATLAATTGSNNISIGHNAGNDAVATLTTQSNYVVLGNNSTTNANIKVAWTVTSDGRDKTDVVNIPIGLDFVTQLRPKQFKLIDRETQQPTTGDRYGFIAQDIQSIEGSTSILVDDTDADNLKLKESMIVPVLVKAIQELTARVEQLESQLSQSE